MAPSPARRNAQTLARRQPGEHQRVIRGVAAEVLRASPVTEPVDAWCEDEDVENGTGRRRDEPRPDTEDEAQPIRFLFPSPGLATENANKRPIAGSLIANAYGRNEEYAADRHGVDILERVGYPTATMMNTLTWLTQIESTSGGGFFATHPATSDRIESLRNVH